MKLLLDENLPHDLRHLIREPEVLTVDYLGWKGLKNGELLRRVAEQSIDVILTLDSGMQVSNMRGGKQPALLIVRAVSNRMEDLEPLVPHITRALTAIVPGSTVRIGE